MSTIGLLLVVVAGCLCAPDLTRRDDPSLFGEPLTTEEILQLIKDHLTQRNVFPPYEPLFSPELWEEIKQWLNLTRRDDPSLFGEPLTTKEILQLIKDHLTEGDEPSLFGQPLTTEEILQLIKDYAAKSGSDFIGPFRRIVTQEQFIPLILKRAQEYLDSFPIETVVGHEDLLLEFYINQLGYEEILAILGDYFKGR